MSHSIKSIRKQFKAQGVFYSDSAIARKLKSYLPDDVKEVYDPTSGGGELLAAFGDDVRKYGQELDPGQAESSRQRLKNAEIAEGDTLVNPAFIDRRFMAITANPPFSIAWDHERAKNSVIFNDAPCVPPPSKADYAFILHCLHCLHEDGTAAILEFPGILYRGQREGKIREWLVRENYVDAIEHIPGGHFEDTKVETIIIVLKKNRKQTSVRFRDDRHDIERDVPFEEIEANGFNLSVNSYILPPQPEKPPFDPIATELAARGQVLRNLEAQLKFSTMAVELHEMLGLPPLPPISDFIRDIRRVVAPYLKHENETKNNIDNPQLFLEL